MLLHPMIRSLTISTNHWVQGHTSYDENRNVNINIQEGYTEIILFLSTNRNLETVGYPAHQAQL